MGATDGRLRVGRAVGYMRNQIYKNKTIVRN